MAAMIPCFISEATPSKEVRSDVTTFMAATLRNYFAGSSSGDGIATSSY